MNITVLGGDGYCGWATALYLSKRGHDVSIVDNFSRRQWDHELGVQTLTPIQPLTDRLRVWQHLTGREIAIYRRRRHQLSTFSGVGDRADARRTRSSTSPSSAPPPTR